MKTVMKTLLAASLLCGAGMIASAPASAQASFQFRVDDYGVGFSDGYYDRSNRWHRWRHQREREWYRANFARRYHSHDRDMDGIPDRWDRDMDNDGVPNYRDSRPNNPYRR